MFGQIGCAANTCGIFRLWTANCGAHPVEHAGPALHGDALEHRQHREQDVVEAGDAVVWSLQHHTWHGTRDTWRCSPSTSRGRWPRTRCRGRRRTGRSRAGRRSKVRSCSVRRGQLCLNRWTKLRASPTIVQSYKIEVPQKKPRRLQSDLDLIYCSRFCEELPCRTPARWLQILRWRMIQGDQFASMEQGLWR